MVTCCCCLTDEEQRQGGAAVRLLLDGQFEMPGTWALLSQGTSVYIQSMYKYNEQLLWHVFSCEPLPTTPLISHPWLFLLVSVFIESMGKTSLILL